MQGEQAQYKNLNLLCLCNQLTCYQPMLPSYRNQSTDLLSKSIDWFLCDEMIGREWANAK